MTLSGDHAHLRKSTTRRQRTFGFSPETSEQLSALTSHYDATLTATMTTLIRRDFQRLRRQELIPPLGERACAVCLGFFRPDEFGQTECDPSGCPSRYGDIDMEGV